MKKEIKQTSITKSNKSLITTIPKEITRLENITDKNKIIWHYDIQNNKHIYIIEFKKDKK